MNFIKLCLTTNELPMSRIKAFLLYHLFLAICVGPGGLACEPQGSSMAVGWAQAMPVGGVPAAQDAYYPVSADCEPTRHLLSHQWSIT